MDPAACDPVDRRALALALPDVMKPYTAAVTTILNGPERPIAEAAVLDEEEQARIVTGLVALRAYWHDQREPVDRWVRGVGRSGEASIVARCARAGMAHLPAVVGPVFAAIAELPDYAGLTRLVEPGFIEAGLAPAGLPDDGTDFVIWSASARQLGRVVHKGSPTALFPPGSAFDVVDVATSARRQRVFLVESVGGQAETGVLERLRRAIAQPPTAPVVAPGWPIGVDRLSK